MKTARLTPFLPLAALLAIDGCRNPAPGYTPTPQAAVTPVSASSVRAPEGLMPLNQGDRWNYDLRIQNFDPAGKMIHESQEAAEMQVEEIHPDGTAVLVLNQGGQPADRQTWRSDGQGIYATAGSLQDVPFNPPQPLFLIPLRAGRRFSWQGRGLMPDGRIAEGRLDGEILNPQSVDTGMGTLSAVPITTVTRDGDAKTTNSTWFRPGVGIIRLHQEVVAKGRNDITILTLSNYSVKQR